MVEERRIITRDQFGQMGVDIYFEHLPFVPQHTDEEYNKMKVVWDESNQEANSLRKQLAWYIFRANEMESVALKYHQERNELKAKLDELKTGYDMLLEEHNRVETIRFEIQDDNQELRSELERMKKERDDLKDYIRFRGCTQ